MAKFSYKANPNSPLGKELSCTQKDKLTFISCHPKNEAWWVTENQEGEQGYVPASYMLVSMRVDDETLQLLTHCGLVTPNGVRDLGPHWLR